MPRFKPYDTSQNLLVPVNLAEQLVSGSFEYTLNSLVDHEIDTSIFHEHYNNDETGRLAYNPAMLLKVVSFAYSRGSPLVIKLKKPAGRTLYLWHCQPTVSLTLRTRLYQLLAGTDYPAVYAGANGV